LLYKIYCYENTKKMENGIDHLGLYLPAHQYHIYHGDAADRKLAPTA